MNGILNKLPLLGGPEPEPSDSMLVDITDGQSDLLMRELRAITAGPQDEASIVFRLAYNHVRLRELTESPEGEEPPMDIAVTKAAELTRADFPDFEPTIGTPEESTAERPGSDEGPVITEILAHLRSTEPTGSTGLEWMLFGEETKARFRETYEHQRAGEDITDLANDFRAAVHDRHMQRPPQVQQYREFGQDAVE